MHGELMANQKNLQVEQLSIYAQRIRVEDLATFDECLASGKYAPKIRSSVAEGAKGGAKGTPSFLLGVTGEDGSVKVLKLIQGAQSYAVFQKAIDELIVASAADGTAKQAATVN
jgi:predicted DsbA family dithiol-disulfide isomerase